MSNWESNFVIGDRVSVAEARTSRDPRTHRIVVNHHLASGRVATIDLDGEGLGVRFDDGRVREVSNSFVRKVA